MRGDDVRDCLGSRVSSDKIVDYVDNLVVCFKDRVAMEAWVESVLVYG
jgi:hypothetical protein